MKDLYRELSAIVQAVHNGEYRDKGQLSRDIGDISKSYGKSYQTICQMVCDRLAAQ